jgi:hypothetical protein
VSKKTKPLLGHAFIFYGGLVILIASVLAYMNITIVWGGLNLTGHGSIFGGILGILIVIFSLVMYYVPKSKMYLGILVIILATLNMVLGYDIVALGSILVIIGGILDGFMGK